MKNCPRGVTGGAERGIVRVAGPGTTVERGNSAGPAGGRMPRLSPRARTVRRAQARAAPAPHLAAPSPHPAGRTRRQRRIGARAAAPIPAPRPGDPERTPPEELPTDASVDAWLRRHLPGTSYPKPVCKRLALLVGGLLVKGDCTLGALAAAVDGLAVSTATAESVERRRRRVLHDD